MLGLFHVFAIVTNWQLFGQSFFATDGLPVFGLAAICFVAALTKRKGLQQVMAMLYLIIGLVGLCAESPAAY
ncbi:MAG: hypothetical protein INR68_05305 [Methylobacterium mesophilicum]|nr:hypothetical protein [Methylobacterium mesophilicum]